MKETVFLSHHLWLWDNRMTLYCRRKSWNVTSIKYKSLRHHLTYSFQYFIRFNLDAIACNIQTSYVCSRKMFYCEKTRRRGHFLFVRYILRNNIFFFIIHNFFELHFGAFLSCYDSWVSTMYEYVSKKEKRDSLM